MDIYEFAMRMEKEGEEYYRDLASKTAHPGLRSVFGMLAEAKAKHYGLFKSMKKNEKAQITDTALMGDVKSIFRQMKKKKETDLNLPDRELYGKALDIERTSIDFYRSRAEQVKDPFQKEALLKIAREEEKHFSILEEILEFVERPSNWLENPEWYHLEEY